MNRKTTYSIFVVVIYATLISVYFYFVNDRIIFNEDQPYVKFCDTVNQPDNIIAENFKISSFHSEEFFNLTFLRGTPSCSGGMKSVGEFSKTELEIFQYVGYN